MTTAIIVAAGSSSRMKTNISKQLIELDGIPVIIRTINVFEFLSEIDSVLIVTRKCDIEIIKKLVSEHNIKKSQRSNRRRKHKTGICFSWFVSFKFRQ